MKTCIPCGKANESTDGTCLDCGEASFEQPAPVTERKPPPAPVVIASGLEPHISEPFADKTAPRKPPHQPNPKGGRPNNN